MKKFTLFFSFLFSIIAFQSFAQENPYFIIEEDGANYFMYLKVENASNLQAITITGYSSISGKTERIKVDISGTDIDQLANNIAKINHLSKENEIAVYHLSTLDKQGNLIDYPSVEIMFPSSYLETYETVALAH